LPPGVGLIRVVVRREAPRKLRMLIRRPVVAGAKRPRQRKANRARHGKLKNETVYNRAPVERNVRLDA